jgi:hypothetical protein
VIGTSAKPAVVHLPIPRRRLTDQMIAKARDARLATAREARDTAATRAMYSSANVPKHLPFFESLKPGPGGELWVQEAAVGTTDAVRYLVLAANGSPRAWVNAPAGVRLLDVGLEHVVGVYKDADGVESVRVYRLARR